MATLEQIENGAAHYDIEAAKARYAETEHRRLGTKSAQAWAEKAIEHERVARELRALASD